MRTQLSSWWKKIKIHPLATTATFILIIIIGLTTIIHIFGWAWTGFNGGYSTVITTTTTHGITTATTQPQQKTLWDWLNLLGVLAIPAAVGLGTIWFTRQQAKVSNAENKDNQCEAVLQEYINKMSELLLDRKLREPAENAEVRTIARVRTLTVLARLDPIRKKSILQFLHESSLVNKNEPIIDLTGADLSGADLSGADLRGMNLSRANLSGANLSRANLIRGTLSRTNLSGANLSGANLREVTFRGDGLFSANLSGANLSGAALNGANLSNADLTGANLNGNDLSRTNLSGANLSGANLSGIIFRREHRPFTPNLSGANLSGANLREAIFTGDGLFPANLSGANLSRATLNGTDLSGANLSGTDLSGANLSGVHFEGAKLNMTHLEGANLTATDPNAASSLKGTKMNRAIGLTPEQREVCIKKGAIFDNVPQALTSATSSSSSFPSAQSNDGQAPLAPFVQESTPTPGVDESTTTPLSQSGS